MDVMTDKEDTIMTKKEQKAMQVTDQETAKVEDQERTRERRVFIPKTDIFETEKAIALIADLPGVNPESVDITLEKNILTIDGYAAPGEQPGLSINYSEYTPGDFHRQFRLTEEIDRDKIEASVSDGVLKLILPKAEDAKVKKIPIKIA
jgi:HSP20 family protein